MSWSRQATKNKQIYYEVFHCNKNCYVDVLHKPLVDAYDIVCLGRCDKFATEPWFSSEASLRAPCFRMSYRNFNLNDLIEGI